MKKHFQIDMEKLRTTLVMRKYFLLFNLGFHSDILNRNNLF